MRLNVSRSSAQHLHRSVATTDAARGESYSSASSPKEVPGVARITRSRAPPSRWTQMSHAPDSRT